MLEHDQAIDILHEEGPCLVVNKPSGLLTQAPPGIDSLELRLKDMFRARLGRSGNVYLAVLHRLDRPVSGAIVFARHVRAARRVSEQFETRTVAKVYWACVAGRVQPDDGVWRDTLRKVSGEALAHVVADNDPEGRPAVLDYRVLGRAGWGTWLEIRLETGRTHQIRVQAASRGHPVLGDQQYGSTVAFGTQFEDVRLRAIALHSRRLGFQHPMTRQSLDVVAPLPAAWNELGLAFD